MNKINIGIIGVGGYGFQHILSIDYCRDIGLCELKAAVIRNQDMIKNQDAEKKLMLKGVRIYRSYPEMLEQEKGNIGLIAIPCGIDQHEEQAVRCLINGYHVICEKPVAGTYTEALRMRETARKSEKILSIGYQYIFSASIQKIKTLTIEKKLGRLLKAKTYVLWPRTSIYYDRNSWAGKMKINDKLIYDSPLQNATAHFLNTMLYVAGLSPDASADIRSVYGENYRAKNIESADTQYIRVETAGGVILHQYATHAAADKVDPMIEFDYEYGKITWQLENNGLSQVYEKNSTGELILIEKFDDGPVPIKHLVFKNTIEAIQNRQKPLANIDNSIQQTLCIEKSFESGGNIITVPENAIETLICENNPEQNSNHQGPEYNIIIKDIKNIIETAYRNETGFTECGVTWAKQGKTVTIQ